MWPPPRAIIIAGRKRWVSDVSATTLICRSRRRFSSVMLVKSPSKDDALVVERATPRPRRRLRRAHRRHRRLRRARKAEIGL